jgi:hypothetical protein
MVCLCNIFLLVCRCTILSLVTAISALSLSLSLSSLISRTRRRNKDNYQTWTKLERRGMQGRIHECEERGIRKGMHEDSIKGGKVRDEEQVNRRRSQGGRNHLCVSQRPYNC